MRSKTVQRILDKMDKDPWWVKLKRWFVVELHIIKCLGIVKYIKHKIQSGGGIGQTLYVLEGDRNDTYPKPNKRFYRFESCPDYKDMHLKSAVSNSEQYGTGNNSRSHF